MDLKVCMCRTAFGVRFRLARQLALLAFVLVFADAALSFQEAVPEVSLQLACLAPCRYQQGETISLELAFTSSTPNKYQVETNNTDWPITFEDFEVLPREGASDPVSAYLKIITLALSLNVQFHYLSKVPVVILQDLNQHIRFDRPGHYRVQAAVSGHKSQFYHSAADEASATTVTVNAPNDTPAIDFALSPVSG